MCGQCSTGDLRACCSVTIRWLAEPIRTTLGRDGLPEQGMVFLRRTGPELHTRHGDLEYWFLLPASHPVRTGSEFCDRHSETSIDQIPAIFLRDDNIVLLPQVAHDLVNRCGRGCVLIAVCRFRRLVGKRCAPLGNLPGATHTESLNLFRGDTEFYGKLRIPRSLGKPLKEAVSLILGKSAAAMRCFPICKAGL